jgi:YhcH/YjgK/YiaL family protein
MILDTLDHAMRYAPLHPRFPAAFEYLRSARLQDLAPGKHALDGDLLFVLLSHDPGRGREAARLESHRKYIDIQYVHQGNDLFGWKPVESCREIEMPYDPQRDLAFYRDTPDLWTPLPQGTFAIFYPEDAHAPLAGEGALVKAVVKIAIEW